MAIIPSLSVLIFANEILTTFQSFNPLGTIDSFFWCYYCIYTDGSYVILSIFPRRSSLALSEQIV